ADGSYTYTVDNSNAAVQALRISGQTLTDTFTYTMRDTAGLTSTTQITVTIQGANDAPHDLAGTLTVAENAANGTSAGTVTRSDVDSGDGASYSLVDDAGGRFAINSSTGVVTVANGTLLNREAAASHNITVRVTDTAGATYDEVMSVTITDVDEFDVGAVSDTNATANSLAENSANGTIVNITASASDADATNNTITYSLDDSAGGRFTINSSTGVVTVANSSLLNFEAATSHSITIRATSADASFSTQIFTISLTDVDEFDVGAVSDSNATSNSVAENAANGTVVGVTASASDADGSNNTITYSLDDSAGGRFTINSSTGVVTVANSSLLNFEAATSHNITLRATSADASFSTQVFTINLTNVNETPTAVSDTVTAVEAGGVSNGTAGTNPTGNVLTNDTDVDAGDTKTVTGVAAGTVGSASGSVATAVSGSYGSINIAADAAHTYTVDNSTAPGQALRTSGNTLTDTFTYTMRDTAGLTSTTQITVTIQGANDNPHDLAGTLTVAE
ncbi:MAG: cadherin domain-containing protein, partial [Pirellulaceae bacterium]